MIGEAVATGAPVHIFAPSGGSPKIKLFRSACRARRGAALDRDAQRWTYEPINQTPKIAAAIRRAYQVYRGELPPLPAWRPPDNELLHYGEGEEDE